MNVEKVSYLDIVYPKEEQEYFIDREDILGKLEYELDRAKKGELRIGEVTINTKKVLIPFRKDVDLTNPKDWIAIDINESNVTCVSSNPHVIRIEHGLRTIHTTYFEIRRRIQKLSKYKPITVSYTHLTLPTTERV